MSKFAKKATLEEVWAVIKAGEESRIKAEEARIRAEEARIKGMEDLREALKKSRQEVAEAQKQTEESLKQTQKEVRELNDSLKEANGNFNNKWGRFLENFLKGDFVNLLKKWGIKATGKAESREYREGKRIVAEYDLVASNGKEVVVAEVKTTLEKKHIALFIEKLKKFKIRFPKYKNKTVYGAVAFMGVRGQEKDKNKDYPEYLEMDAVEMAKENGLLIIESPGGARDMSEILNEKGFQLKEF